MANEQILEGGNGNWVVRVGNTVHRQTRPSGPTVQHLLKHVRARGVSWVPEPLGFDEQGREVLSFLPGEVVQEIPDWLWRDSLLQRIAQALRQLHDATADFHVAGAIWGLPDMEPREVICHNDFAPYNCVFRQEHFVGAIDFDTCAPGPRLWDLCYAAYRFIPLLPPKPSANELGHFIWNDNAFEFSPFDLEELYRRIEVFAAAYAQTNQPLRYTSEQIIAFAWRRLEALADWTEARSQQIESEELNQGTRMYRAHAVWLRQLFPQG